jgi:arylsulfatase A-like enzyme
MRQGGVGDRAAARAALLMLTLAALGCPSHDRFAHPWSHRDDLELTSLEVAGVTRPGLWLEPDGSRELPLGRIEAGPLTTHLAAEKRGTRDVEVQIWLRTHGSSGGRAPNCELRWSPTDPEDWRPCRIEVARTHSDAVLEIRWAGTNATRVFVSSPITTVRGRQQRPPIFVLMLDTLRADCASLSGDEVVIGKSFARLAQDGIVFEHARSTSSWTRTAAASLFTGLSPHRHRVLDRLDVMSAGLATLPEELRRHGYQTAAWSSNPNVLPTWGFAQGFDEFTDVSVFPHSMDKTDVRQVLAGVYEKIEASGSSPVFYYIHLMDPHHPYLPPPRFLEKVRRDAALSATFPARRRFVNRGVFHLYQQYLAEIVDLDLQLVRLLDLLVEEGLYDESIVLVLSDHGEEFLDHGDRNHGRTLYEEVVRVPAILKLSKSERAGTRVEQPVDLGDLMPTLLEAAGVPVPDGIDGHSPLDGASPAGPKMATLKLDGRHYTSVVDDAGEWKLILDHAGAVPPKLFRLHDDPAEKQDLFRTHRDKARELSQVVLAAQAASEPGWHLRGCGTGEARMLAFRFSTPGATVRTALLEAADQLESLEGGFEVTLHLQPRSGLNMGYDPPRHMTVSDTDEVVIPAEDATSHGAIEITSAGGEPLLFSIGGSEWVRGTSVRLDTSTRAAQVVSSQVVDCLEPEAVPAEHAGRPYLIVWLAGSADLALDPEQVDPELRERLRSLGYAW